MGVLVRAEHLLSGQEVALKVLPAERLERPESAARLLLEARAMGQLRSRHVVRLLDTGLLDDGSPYLAMELLDGKDLGKHLQEAGALALDEAVGWVMQACEALAEAHGLGVIHRDIKPSNLFLSREPDGSLCLKVLDFGIARRVGNEQGLTRSDGVLGSPQYMAPEQIRAAREVDARADLWALGVVLYQLVSDQLPFKGTSPHAVLAAVVADPPTPLRTHLPGAPEALLRVIGRCLDKSPEGRFSSTAELARALVPLGTPTDAVRAERIAQISARRPSSPSLPERTEDPLDSGLSSGPPEPRREHSTAELSFSQPRPSPALSPGHPRWSRALVGILLGAGMLGGLRAVQGLRPAAVSATTSAAPPLPVVANDPEPSASPEPPRIEAEPTLAPAAPAPASSSRVATRARSTPLPASSVAPAASGAVLTAPASSPVPTPPSPTSAGTRSTTETRL
jgi:serine/threonine-protein kinase